MRWLPITRSSLTMDRVVADRHVRLRDDVCGLYRDEAVEPAESLDAECASFVLWSVHIAMLNMPGSAIDRWIAGRCFERYLAGAAPRLGIAEAPDRPSLAEMVHRRRIDALRTIRNVYLRHDPRTGALIAPSTEATARLFLVKTCHAPADVQRRVAPRLAPTLSNSCCGCVADLSVTDWPEGIGPA